MEESSRRYVDRCVEDQEPLECGRLKTEYTQKMKRTLTQRGNYIDKANIQNAKFKNR